MNVVSVYLDFYCTFELLKVLLRREEKLMQLTQSLQTIFISLIGLLLVIYGIDKITNAIKLKKPDNVFFGRISEGKLVETRDDQGRLIQHYYSLQVVYPDGNKQVSSGFKSTVSYEKDEKIYLYKDNDNVYINEKENISALSGLFLCFAGVALALTIILNQYAGELAASYALAFIFLFLGLSLFFNWYNDHKLNLKEYKGEISDVLLYQNESNNRGGKGLFKTNTYYPLIKAEIEGKEKTFLSKYGSSASSVFKTGKTSSFFYDKETNRIIERISTKGTLIASIVFFAIFALGLISSFIGG